jgi:hypothetical protein
MMDVIGRISLGRLPFGRTILLDALKHEMTCCQKQKPAGIYDITQSVSAQRLKARSARWSAT